MLKGSGLTRVQMHDFRPDLHIVFVMMLRRDQLKDLSAHNMFSALTSNRGRMCSNFNSEDYCTLSYV